MIRLLLPLVLLAACDSSSTDSADTGTAADTDTDAETGDSDTGPAPTDGDKDGYDSTTDCNDKDHTIHPDAVELCNGIDENCDQVVDEGFDVDGDGATSADLCETGTDCDDAEASVLPSAPEVPYDGIDQDCDGEDLIDVDGDRYDYTFDCDDTNADVHPGAIEVAKNGLDDDCVDGDSIDTDGDGYGDDNFGGEDCDDTDPLIHPGVRDYWYDGVDADCDALDARVGALADATVSIVGDAGEQGLVGETVAFCDLDEDGLDDLIVTAPFASSYAGRIGIWYGSGSSTWGPDMAMTDADTLIESNQLFLGFGLQCADIDGDSHLDLVTTRGEIHYSSYEADYELMFFYGTGGKLPATLDEGDADARLSYPLGVTTGISQVFAQNLTAGDLDGDGAAELLVNDAKNDNASEATGYVYVLKGKPYSGSSDLVDEIVATIEPGGDGASHVRILGDVSGDGTVDLFVGKGNYVDTGDSAYVPDTAGATSKPGRAFFTDASMVDAAVADLAWRTWNGRAGDNFGWDALVFDLDGDGDDDTVVSALGYPGDYSGALYFLDGIPVSGSPSDATAELLGSTAAGEFGFTSARVSDIDGDGADDLLVSELLGGASGEGTLWLISSGLAWSGVGSAESAARLAWSGEEAGANTGNSLAAGDSDGDGEQEYAIGAETWLDGGTDTLGKVYVIR